MTINSAIEAAKVKIGSKWSVANEYHTAITNDILSAGEVEIYNLALNDCGEVTVTVIYGEGETAEFELYLFVHLFKHENFGNLLADFIVEIERRKEFSLAERQAGEMIERLEAYRNKIYQASASIYWDQGAQDKAVVVKICSTCFHHQLMEDTANGGAAVTDSNYECDHCAIVTSHQNKKTGFTPNLFILDDVLLNKEKPKRTSKLKAFLNKKPLSTGMLALILILYIMFAILSDVVASNWAGEQGSINAVSLVAVLIFFTVIVVDIIRTINEKKRNARTIYFE